MARTDNTFTEKDGSYIKTIWSQGRNWLINGANKYLNFNSISGETGYGIRDNDGTLQAKNSGGSWANLGVGGGNAQTANPLSQFAATTLAQLNGVISDATLGDASDFATAEQGTTADNALPKAGGTMTGNIALNGNYLSGDGGDEGVFVASSGNVGIGTAVPGSKLSVNGGISAGTYSATAAPSNGMIISGNVGIGTASPSAKLDVYGVSTFTENVTSTYGSAVVRGSDITPDLTTKGILDIEQSGTAAAQGKGATLTFSNNNWQFGTSFTRVGGSIKVGLDSTVNQNPVSHMAFSVTGAGSVLNEQMRITNTGNVGIGTTAPDTLLHNAGAYTQEPLSSDPADPDAGNSVQWVSSGVGSGDAGDIMLKVNVGGTTKVITLIDYSVA